MTTPHTHSTFTEKKAVRVTASLRRVLSIARAETLLYLRNPTIVATAFLLTPLMVLFLAPLAGERLQGPAFEAALAGMLAVWSLLMVVYYNLTVIFVSRREEGVFQRMSTGEASAWEALIAASLPSSLVALLQVGLGSAAIIVLLGTSGVRNILLILVAVLAGAFICGALAAWSSTWTTTVEGAQYSTLPIFMVLLLLSGTSLPASLFPEKLRLVAECSPMWAIADLVGLGITGTTVSGSVVDAPMSATWSHALRPLGVLTVSCVCAWFVARRHMRFARRR